MRRSKIAKLWGINVSGKRLKESPVFLEDVNAILADTNIPWEKLRGARVLVTGATGMIGSVVVRVLSELNARNGYGILIAAAGRSEEKGRALERLQGVTFWPKDVREPFDAREPVDYILHCAAVTNSAKMVSDPAGVIGTEVLGARNVLELARAGGIKGMVYTSSMEVYGLLDKEEVFEEDQGYIDLSNARSCYPQSKRTAENLCACYHAQYGLPVSTVRLGMTFGAGCDINDPRVWAQFARSAIAGEDLILRTEGKSVTSVLYLADAVSALITALFSGGGTYNAAAASMTIREIAETVAGAYGVKVIVDKPADAAKLGYSGDFKLPLNTDRLKALGWRARVSDVAEMFGLLVNDWEGQL